MQLIRRIEVENFKSFLKESVTFEDMTAIVGANESGKSNVLKALHHFSRERLYKEFGREEGDFRLDSPDFPNGEVSLALEIILSEELIPNLAKLEPKLVGKVFRLEKRGKLNSPVSISGTFPEKLSGIMGILKINNKHVFRTKMQGMMNKDRIDHIVASGWTFKDASINLTANPAAGLLREKKIENLNDVTRDKYIAEKVRDEVILNIKMLLWKYEEKEHYLPQHVTVSDFVANPDKYPGVDCMFSISGWKRIEYADRLINYDSTTRDQSLRSVQDTVNELIRKHWSTHKELTVKLSFNGDSLDISLSEPGHQTPPNFRSDGFKWFLAFLLFFKRHAANLNGHILLIDEPGGFLHPQGQKDVLKELTSLASDNQVIYTTHQTFLINKNLPESVRIIKREKRARGKDAYDSRVYSLKDDRKHIFTDKLLRESLGFLVSDISPLNELNILVEGEFDREIIIEANKRFRTIDLNDVSVIGCGRASNIQKYSALYTASDLKTVGLYDSDGAGKGLHDAAKDMVKMTLQDAVSDPKIETMEDMIPKEVFLDGIKEWKKKSGITGTFTSDSPRMEAVNKALTDPEKKVLLKHLLEDSLMEAVRKGLASDHKKFEDLGKLLTKLKDRLGSSSA